MFGRFRFGLRGRLTAWLTAVLAASLSAGFVWVHVGLARVLESKNDDFLSRKAAEWIAVASADGREGLRGEIDREVSAYADDGLIVALRGPDGGIEHLRPDGPLERRLFGRALGLGRIEGQARTIEFESGRYRFARFPLRVDRRESSLEIALSTRPTEATLSQFDRRAAAGGLAFAIAAWLGGSWLSSKALRPVARSVATARRLNPEDLSARLPRTGAGDELDELAATINDLLDRLADYHAQAARFTADASHELRGPLAAIRATIDVALQKGRTAEEYREVLAALGEQCDRLTVLVNGLLLLARADAGQVDLRRERLDLAAAADEVAEMYAPLAEERGLNLRSEANAPVFVHGDAARLRQLANNLVDNAVKFTEAGGSIVIRVDESAGFARLIVRDDGVGIQADQLTHVFERFHQADPARASQGFGLGLSICRAIALAHGGSIEARSSPGRGSVFTVLLPKAND